MGEWRFGFDPKLCANSPWLSNTGDAESVEWYLGSLDGQVAADIIWSLDGNYLCAHAPDSSSGRLFSPCEIPSYGKVFLFTGSLMCRPEPYNLLIELARGKIGQLRNQSSLWRMNHMRIPEEFDELLEESHRYFSQGVPYQSDYEKSGELALKSLQTAFIAAEMLMNSFVHQRLQLQQKKEKQPSLNWSCGWSSQLEQFSKPETVTKSIDEIRLPFSWKQFDIQPANDLWKHHEPAIEWCQKQELEISGGPLLDFSDNGMPDCMLRWEQDVLSLQSIMCDYLESTVSQFGSKIRKWEVVSAADRGATDWQWGFLTEEIRLKLAMRALEVVSQVDPQLELSVRVVDPWGQYQNRRKHQINPLQFVDILTRSRAEISTINLQLTRGFESSNSPSFDELELSRQLDLWGRLGIPVQVTLAIPSQSGRSQSAVIQPKAALTEQDLNESKQSDWFGRIIPLLIAKDCVSGIQFTHYCDQSPHEFAYSGLVNEQGMPKEAMQRMIRYRDYDWLED